ncbi:hypothetical protein HPB50_004589 [Hyalomma asiaticum]|uniref:Uncharacterized protein n=1 Tax=Hyalomma asiaticum TaxID=266040 RepID=A0ACB7TH56_HYAAI|nr:hypothetical protein HPB50_004589 [Hyalomma asiaticum]
MDPELHARLPDPVLPAAAASRKRSSDDTTDSDDTMSYYVSGEDSGDDSFELVRSRKATRRLEAAASIERRSRRRRCSKPFRASSPCQPCSKSPPPLPPRPHAVGSKDKTVSSSETRDACPELPKLQVPDERRQPSTANDTSSVPYKLTDEDKQVVAIISSLASAIRILLYKMQTPTARSALLVLDAISPVLASLQKSST